MSYETDSQARFEASMSQTTAELDQLAASVREIAEKRRSDSLALLALLRVLESLHREICEGAFQESLPDNRQALYALLRDIEATGGWPYVYRMRLQDFMRNLIDEDESEVD